MLDDHVIWFAAFAYMAMLFGVAHYADKRADAGRSIISNAYVYTLSIAVYCTAWTFYGSVGRAANSGIDFLPIYLGPTLMAALWWFVLRKMIRISKAQRITSIADFIGSRYGKSALLGGLVTIIAVVGIMPYIALQLKAVSTSYFVVRHYPALTMPGHSAGTAVWADTSLYVALLLAAFAILFGTRHTDVSERHEGMVAAIALESVVKLFAFFAVGVFVTFQVFDGPGDLFGQAAAAPRLAALMGTAELPGGYAGWLTLTFLSMMAITFLPRQFQVAVVENVDEDHVRKAVWLFPLYLLLINLFVLPLAFGGLLLFEGGGVDPDTFVLTVPMARGQAALALLVFIGGLSAATGMVIVATIALSTMVSNDLVIPLLLRMRSNLIGDTRDLTRLLLAIRRGTIIIVLLLGYLYFRLIGESYTLVTIGLVSFSAAAQFGPAILLGIFWKGASRRGALAGLSLGFVVWAYTLLLPGFARSGWIAPEFLDGLFGLSFLRPYELFGLTGLDPITHSTFWSMLLNVGSLVGISLFDRQSGIERVQARHFVDVFREDDVARGGWQGTATVAELEHLVTRFLGLTRARGELAHYAARQGGPLEHEAQASPEFIGFAERLLAGSIGAASARVMVSSVLEGEAVSLEGVMEILDETSQVMKYSRQLEQKSRELEEASADLRSANVRLQELDQLKDEFVSTVSHELRTPLTSIRAFSEILQRNPELDAGKRQEFLDIVVRESERLTRLINNVLDLAKIESGRMDWQMEPLDLLEVVQESLAGVSQLFSERDVRLHEDLPHDRAPATADRDRLTQVMVNLLSNAGKYCDPDDGEVAVRVSSGDGTLRVEVADNGRGIPATERERVFEKFHQLDDGQAGKTGGTGLGLAISQGIIEHHGGRIWCESTDRGATFVFQIPAGTTPDGQATDGPAGSITHDAG